MISKDVPGGGMKEKISSGIGSSNDTAWFLLSRPLLHGLIHQVLPVPVIPVHLNAGKPVPGRIEQLEQVLLFHFIKLPLIELLFDVPHPNEDHHEQDDGHNRKQDGGDAKQTEERFCNSHSMLLFRMVQARQGRILQNQVKGFRYPMLIS